SDGFCQSTFEFAGTCDELVQYASTLPKFCPDGTALSEPGLGCTVPNFSILASPDFTFTTPLVFNCKVAVQGQVIDPQLNQDSDGDWCASKAVTILWDATPRCGFISW